MGGDRGGKGGDKAGKGEGFNELPPKLNEPHIKLFHYFRFLFFSLLLSSLSLLPPQMAASHPIHVATANGNVEEVCVDVWGWDTACADGEMLMGR